MSDDREHVFISHIHEDDEDLKDLKDLLSRKGYDIRDASIHSLKPNGAQNEDYIKSQILRPRIKWAGTLIVLISEGTHESEYVNWEIEEAHKQSKRIVGVWARGSRDSDLPESLRKYGDDTVVGWQADCIMAAIRGEGVWQSASGGARPAELAARHGC